MEPIIKTIEGYNQEKAALTNALNTMEYYSGNTSQVQVKDIKERIGVIDKILTEITASFLNPKV